MKCSQEPFEAISGISTNTIQASPALIVQEINMNESKNKWQSYKDSDLLEEKQSL